MLPFKGSKRLLYILNFGNNETFFISDLKKLSFGYKTVQEKRLTVINKDNNNATVTVTPVTIRHNY